MLVVSYIQPVTQRYELKHSIKVATMKIWMISVTQKAVNVLLLNRHFAVWKDEWNIKEDTGKFLKNALYMYMQQYAKRYLSGRRLK